MGICPVALYKNLCLDLTDQVGGDLVSLFEKLDSPPPDLSTREMAAYQIQKSLLKKLQKTNSTESDRRALAKFLAINIKCEKWSLVLKDSWDEVLWGELRRSLHDFFHPNGVPIFDSITDFFHHGRVGPGSSIGALGGDFYTKMFSSPLTTTRSSLYLAYKNYIKNFPEWSNAEFIRQQTYGEAHVVEGNRLRFVPKDDKISRTICVEPSLNMFVQLGAGHIIERRLLSAYGINLADQPFKNRELARQGSLGHGLITCDLSSASDSLSLSMLRACLPKHVMGSLEWLRSPVSETTEGQVKLNMVSTMGNGYTFPLQTALFASIVVAAFRARGLKPRYPRGGDFGNFGVFGDDIICPDQIWPDVRRLLDLCGFDINYNKTFVEGPFRESCGNDFYRGHNLRGVYVKRLTTQQDRVSVINQLNLFSTRTGIRLPKAVQYLLRSVEWLPVPRGENDVSGIKVPYSLIRKDAMLDPNGSALYRHYEPVGLRIRILESALIYPRTSKRGIYNPSGLFVSFLQRSINSCTIGVRHDLCRYKKKRRVTPFWDANPSVHPLQGWFPWQRWDTAVYFNLFG
jgi:hypothetical protein